LLLEFAKPAKQSESPWFPTPLESLEEVACDLCGDQTPTNGSSASKSIRCKNCELVYCSPRPTQAHRWVLEPLEEIRDGTDVLKEVRMLRQLAKVNSQSRVLIAGSGGGQFAQSLIERVGCEVLCVEDHPALVRRARARGLCVQNSDISDLAQSGFDLVLFLNTLERSVSPTKALSAARRSLAPGGRVIVKTFDGTSSKDPVDPSRALYTFTGTTLNALLHRTGLRETRRRKARNHLWCMAEAQ
jgi:SAM-dependent methyltransferase